MLRLLVRFTKEFLKAQVNLKRGRGLQTSIKRVTRSQPDNVTVADICLPLDPKKRPAKSKETDDKVAER